MVSFQDMKISYSTFLIGGYENIGLEYQLIL